METGINNIATEKNGELTIVINHFTEQLQNNLKAVSGLIEAVEQNSQHIVALTKQVETLLEDHGEESNSLTVDIIEQQFEKLKDNLKRQLLPEARLDHLVAAIQTNNELRQQPPPQKVVHQHHAANILWVTAGLFVLLLLASGGWYSTSGKLDQYKANDIKYRYLKQKSTFTNLQFLYRLDSLQVSSYPMRDSVESWEAEERKAFELNKKLREQSAAANEVKGELKELQIKEKLRKETGR
ncbi:hypothetical protein QWZ08_10520 [Ferruginibacter paludis]|uniref:hypothetical protein n=1 Tax=Ferruginibacter paludis TaxID=1310417 RepID=UPI0025B35CF0|nr:hypothetical protein [Ferruginibacter paludis]MDN3656061.1 hypothetical protein [Ferruginibacter paludis]